MAAAVFSPRKMQFMNQASPRGSARKRSLFPSNSPQTNDLGVISELYSDDSDIYSPPLVSPSSSLEQDSPMRVKSDKVIKVANRLEFNTSLPYYREKSPRRSPRVRALNKENIGSGKGKITKQSPRTLFRKSLMETQNFNEHYITVLTESPKEVQEPTLFEVKSTDNLTTPKKNMLGNKELRRSPGSASKPSNIIKPNNFYGKLAPLLAANQTNRIQGMKCVFRPPQQSKAKAKLLFEDNPSKKRERSRSLDVVREAKKRKSVFTGVRHSIPKPVKRSPPILVQPKSDSVREKARKITDLTRTPYGARKTKKDGWEYTLRFTKPMRYENLPIVGEKRKFFKTFIKDLPPVVSGLPSGSPLQFVPQKRIKLLDSSKSYLSPEKPEISASDISDLIDDDENSEKLQNKPEVDDILLRLEEDDEEEKRKEAEREMLMNILEDSPIKMTAIDSLSDCTASLDLNDSLSTSGCSRFVLDDDNENNATPPLRLFSMFSKSSKVSHEGSNRKSSTKKKWHGLGENQLQIDAGQRKFGLCQCPECGMMYQAGEAEDEMQHQEFHSSLNVLRHLPWKNEHVVGNFGMDYAIMITGDDPKSWQRKAQDVLNFVDKSLGITSDNANVMHNHKVFLYIADKRVVGCMVATPVSRAYKMMSSESDVDICSEESYPVRCGVSRMWTLFSYRRRGIASKLLDTVRRNFMYGNILPREDMAFSIPTPDGKRFATKYMESPNFLVYTGY